MASGTPPQPGEAERVEHRSRGSLSRRGPAVSPPTPDSASHARIRESGSAGTVQSNPAVSPAGPASAMSPDRPYRELRWFDRARGRRGSVVALMIGGQAGSCFVKAAGPDRLLAFFAQRRAAHAARNALAKSSRTRQSPAGLGPGGYQQPDQRQREPAPPTAVAARALRAVRRPSDPQASDSLLQAGHR